MRSEHGRALGLCVLTLLSMFWVGAQHAGVDVNRDGWSALWSGYSFALPFMAILAAHEAGHYYAAIRHGQAASLPYFLPMPMVLTGTLGAVVLTRDNIRNRNVLFDVGAAGPWCGLFVALPVLVYGIFTSPVEAFDTTTAYVHEGHSLLYELLLYAIKGPIPHGHDIMLTPAALAGWSGLLVTMINLVPTGQLDGGHVAWALFGDAQARYGRWVRWGLLALSVAQAVRFMLFVWRGDASIQMLMSAATQASDWMVLWVLLTVMEQVGGGHEPTVEPSPLSPRRRVLAWLTLLLFAALFMPTWMSAS